MTEYTMEAIRRDCLSLTLEHFPSVTAEAHIRIAHAFANFVTTGRKP